MPTPGDNIGNGIGRFTHPSYRMSTSTLNDNDGTSNQWETQRLEPLQEKGAIVEDKQFLNQFRNEITTTNTNQIDDHQPPSTKYKIRYLHDWWLEIVGCLFIVGALVAIFATADAYQDQPLPSWPHGITLNSVIAIYVVILKAAVLLILAQGLSHLKWTWFTKSRPLNDLARYDNASRGPLGSISLLWSLRGRDLISSLGAVIVLAAVILDPMAQQVIKYWNCSQVLPSVNATISRTNAYIETGLHIGAGISTIPLGLQSAINAGVFVPEASAVAYDCSTGNCTFSDTFFTIGFTSECEDITDELKFANVTMSYQYTYTAADGSTPLVSTANATMLNATLPSNLSTSYSVNAVSLATYMAMAFNSSASTLEVVLGPRTSNPSPQNYFCSPGSNKSRTSWDCRGYGAARCKIQPAIYSVSSRIESNKLDEKTAVETTNFGIANADRSTVDVTCLTADQKTALAKVGYILPQSHEPQWLPYNVSVYVDSNNTYQYQTQDPTIPDTVLRIVPPQCIYQISGISLLSLSLFFQTYLTGSIVPSGSQWTGPSVIQQFYQSQGIDFDSVTSMLSNISNSLTTHVRANGWSNNSTPALGQIHHSETCIRVQWAWLSFPATMAILTLLFFVFMVWTTNKAQQGVHHDFKSSPLALLFHGLDEGAQRRLESVHWGESNDVAELRSEARNMVVRLRPTEKGWRFVSDATGDGVDGGVDTGGAGGIGRAL